MARLQVMACQKWQNDENGALKHVFFTKKVTADDVILDFLNMQ